jgi:hypothetical protein
MSKTCTKCCEEKSTSDFNKRKASRDGLQSRCRSCQYKATLEWKRNNKDKNYSLDKKWVTKNREKVNNICRRYYQNNRGKELERSALKRANRLKAAPSWLSEDYRKEIKDFYWLAKDLTAVSGEAYHVDHIVPLQGENVCGLHVPWNLQILPADINLSKGNRYANPA